MHLHFLLHSISHPLTSCRHEVVGSEPNRCITELTYAAELQTYSVMYMELHSSEGKGDRGKRTSDRTRTQEPTLYRGVSVMRATETGRDPLSPIALMYWLEVCRYPATPKTCALRLVLCAM